MHAMNGNEKGQGEPPVGYRWCTRPRLENCELHHLCSHHVHREPRSGFDLKKASKKMLCALQKKKEAAAKAPQNSKNAAQRLAKKKILKPCPDTVTCTKRHHLHSHDTERGVTARGLVAESARNGELDAQGQADAEREILDDEYEAALSLNKGWDEDEEEKENPSKPVSWNVTAEGDEIELRVLALNLPSVPKPNKGKEDDGPAPPPRSDEQLALYLAALAEDDEPAAAPDIPNPVVMPPQFEQNGEQKHNFGFGQPAPPPPRPPPPPEPEKGKQGVYQWRRPQRVASWYDSEFKVPQWMVESSLAWRKIGYNTAVDVWRAHDIQLLAEMHAEFHDRTFTYPPWEAPVSPLRKRCNRPPGIPPVANRALGAPFPALPNHILEREDPYCVKEGYILTNKPAKESKSFFRKLGNASRALRRAIWATLLPDATIEDAFTVVALEEQYLEEHWTLAQKALTRRGKHSLQRKATSAFVAPILEHFKGFVTGTYSPFLLDQLITHDKSFDGRVLDTGTRFLTILKSLARLICENEKCRPYVADWKRSGVYERTIRIFWNIRVIKELQDDACSPTGRGKPQMHLA